ncbi:MAG TPA: fused MFS/spermidine synthase, partial [bacterium]|nr:fused MFS/spermidine synthase [bacterium]
ATIFFLPAVCLGTIGPVAAKMAVEAHDETGRAIGNVYAWGAIGSIVGTFLTGYWLIQVLRTSMILATAAGILGLIGLWMLGAQRVRQGAVPTGQVALLLVLLGAIAPWPLTEGRAEVLERTTLERETRWTRRTVTYSRDSVYYHIRVQHLPHPRRGSTIALYLDNLIHGLWVPREPLALEYEYEKVYALITRRKLGVPPSQVTGWPAVRAFFVGGGAYTFPRYLEAVSPGSTSVVSEIDPAVLEACHAAVGLPRDTPIRSLIGDARRTVATGAAQGPFDIIYGDAFNDFSVPWHLTTVEFNRKLKALLAPDGLYLMNLIDLYSPDYPGKSRFVAAMVRTLEAVYGPDNITVIACQGEAYAPAGSTVRTTFVIACSLAPLDLSRLALDPQRDPPRVVGDYLLPVILKPEAREALRRERFVLTDEYAPVDQLLIPVAASR